MQVRKIIITNSCKPLQKDNFHTSSSDIAVATSIATTSLNEYKSNSQIQLPQGKRKVRNQRGKSTHGTDRFIKICH
jgi:hypothetical protein